MRAACHIIVPQISSVFHFLAPSRPTHLFTTTNFVVLVSFHFVLFYFISSRSISRARAHSPASRRANERGKRRFLVSMFIFFLFFFRSALLFGGSRARRDETGNGRGRKEKTRWGTLGFIPVVNNIFIAASSEGKTWGAKVQFRKMFAVSVHADRAAPRCNAFISN